MGTYCLMHCVALCLLFMLSLLAVNCIHPERVKLQHVLFVMVLHLTISHLLPEPVVTLPVLTSPAPSILRSLTCLRR